MTRAKEDADDAKMVSLILQVPTKINDLDLKPKFDGDFNLERKRKGIVTRTQMAHW